MHNHDHFTLVLDTGCECIGYNCGCCVYMDVPKLGLNDTGIFCTCTCCMKFMAHNAIGKENR